MDSSVSPKDDSWFLRVCHHISNAVYDASDAPTDMSGNRRNGIRTKHRRWILLRQTYLRRATYCLTLSCLVRNFLYGFLRSRNLQSSSHQFSKVSKSSKSTINDSRCYCVNSLLLLKYARSGCDKFRAPYRHGARQCGGCSLYLLVPYIASGGTRWRSWLRHCATNRKVVVSILDGVIGLFIDTILPAALWP